MGYAISFSKAGDRIVISSPYHSYRYTKSYKLIGNLWKQIEDDINPKEKRDGWKISMKLVTQRGRGWNHRSLDPGCQAYVCDKASGELGQPRISPSALTGFGRCSGPRFEKSYQA